MSLRSLLSAICVLLYFSIQAQEIRVIDNKGTLQDVTSNSVITSATTPTNPVEGDVWFDTSSNISKIYDGSVWKVIDLDRVTSSATAPTTPVEGDIWFDTSNTSTLTKVFDGTNWIQIQHISDDQKIDVFEILNDSLQLSIEDDLEANKSIALADIAREPWFGDDDDAAATTNTEDIYHMGNVGIGVNDPGIYDLDVQGTGGLRWKNGNHELEFQTPAGHTGLIINRYNLGNRSRFEMLNVNNATVGNRYFELSYNGDNTLFLRKGGNVGIGIAAPIYKLDVNGSFRNTGHGLFNIMNGADGNMTGANKRGIFMWNDTDSNWGIYMARSGAGRALDGGTAVAAEGFTEHAMRFRSNSTTANGFIFENKDDKNLLSIRASDGYAYFNDEVQINELTTGNVGTDEIVVADTDGVLKKVAASNLNNDWKLLGNSGTTSGTNFVGTTDAQDLVFKTNNIEAARFKSGDQRLLFANPGNFAIPGVSSSAVLGINGTTHSRLRITAGDDESYNDSKGASIDLHGNNATANTGVLDLVAGSAASGTNSAIKFWTNSDGSTQQTSAVITGDGDMGIGTTVPAKKLHVEGTARITDVPDGNTTDSILVRNTAGDILKVSSSSLVPEPWFGTDDNAAATLNTEDMYVMSSKIGIGTDSPSEKLSITGGNIRLNTANSKVEGATGLTLQQTGDAHGTSAIHVRNRNWENGLIIEQLGLHDLISTVYKSKTATRHIILESRAADTYLGQHELQIGEGGNPMLVLHNDKSSLRRGDFGVGTTAPTKKLDVDGEVRIRTLNAGADTDEFVVADGTGVLKKRSITDVTQEPWFGDDDDEAATTNTEDIYHMGNVGIGVNDPGIYDLDVQGTGGLRWKNGNHELEFQTPASHTGLIINRNNLGNRSRFEMLNVNNATVGNRYFELSFNGDNALFLRKGGNVGIGIASPVSKFHVYENTALVNNTAGLTIEQDGTGDAITQYLVTGIRRWVTGIDNSDADKFKWASNIDLNSDAHMTLTTTGNLGIGTTAPSYSLDVNGSFRNTGSGLFTVMNGEDGNMTGTNKRGIFMWNDTDSNWGIYMARSGAGRALDGGSAVAGVGFNSHSIRFRVNNNGSQGFIFENSSDVNLFSVRGSDGFTYVRGNMRIDGLGAGNVQSDANGHLSVSSDERLKNITGTFNRGLDAILGLKPINYTWNKTSGLEMKNTYSGFSAQNVQAYIPEAVKTDERGYLTLSDRPIIGALVNSVKELNQKNEILEKENEVLKGKLDNLLLRIEQLERK